MELITLYNEYVQAINVVQRMRAMQKKYFATKDFRTLKICKELESEVDKSLKHLHDIEQKANDTGVVQGLLFSDDEQKKDDVYFKSISILYKAVCTAQQYANNNEVARDMGKAFSQLCELIPMEYKK